MRLAFLIAAALCLLTLAAEPGDVSRWLAVAIATLALGGVAVNWPSTS